MAIETYCFLISTEYNWLPMYHSIEDEVSTELLRNVLIVAVCE
jgi:hypothetical protein